MSFNKQRQALLLKNHDDLDIEIEVLRARLQHVNKNNDRKIAQTKF